MKWRNEMKYTNKKLKKYISLQTRLKALESQIATLRKEFIEQGAGESRDFVVSILFGVREYIVGKKEFETKFGESFLKDNGLVRLTNTTTVNVTEKVEEMEEREVI
jgi:hypothetical protein